MAALRSWCPQPRSYTTSLQSDQVPGAAQVKGESIPRRHVEALTQLRNVPEMGVETTHDLLLRSMRKYGEAPAVGSRPLIKTHHEVRKVKMREAGREVEADKTWTFFELGPYKYLSFQQFGRLAMEYGAGLRKLGLSPGDRLHIYATTSQSWQVTAHAAASQSISIVTTYDTLGEAGLRHALLQNKPRAILTDPHLLTKIIGPLEEATSVSLIVYTTEHPVRNEDLEQVKSSLRGRRVTSLDEVRQLGEAHPMPTVAPTAEDICCIMYTSGSTGPPKGVVLRHKNVVAAIAGVDTIIGRYLGPGDRLLTYLPLAHIIEFVFENACIFWGGTMGYGSPRTISDASCRNCKGDLRELRPTVLIGVPMIWEGVKSSILSKIEKTSLPLRLLFWSALRAKEALLWSNEWVAGATLLDKVVFSKVKEATGGKLRLCLNGGGAIAKDTQRFLSMVLCPMLSGYGLTETGGNAALTDPSAWTDKAIGAIPSSVEIKLVDVPELGYLSSSEPSQGEIFIRGPAVVTEYLDNECETLKAFTEDGWFKTGDVGEFDSQGNLKVIDRKKNIVKTLNGEYIALEKLESIYGSSNVVNSVCIHADPNRQRPIAIIVPSEPALVALLQSQGHHTGAGSMLEPVEDAEKRRVVLRQLQHDGKSSGLSGIEVIDAVVLANEEWTPENGLRTGAQKINRRAIAERYQEQILRALDR